MANCSFGNIEIELGADTDLLMYSTELSKGRITGSIGQAGSGNFLMISSGDGDVIVAKSAGGKS